MRRLSRWHPLELAFWLSTLLPFVLFPNYLSLASQIAITALFALSLDLILGYAGVVSLGHAAFFGIENSPAPMPPGCSRNSSGASRSPGFCSPPSPPASPAMPRASSSRASVI
jgi:hypothetical protein